MQAFAHSIQEYKKDVNSARLKLGGCFDAPKLHRISVRQHLWFWWNLYQAEKENQED